MMDDIYVYKGAVYIYGKVTDGNYEAVTHAGNPMDALSKIRYGYISRYKLSEGAQPSLQFKGTLYRKIYKENGCAYLEPMG